MIEIQRKLMVSVIGDAQLHPDDVKLHHAYETGRALVDNGFIVVTGGMGGVMDSALAGGRSSNKWEHGCCIGLLPGSNKQTSNASINADILISTGLDNGRNLIVAQSDAVIAIGRGAGTLSEMSFAWIYKRLLVALRCSGWSGELSDRKIDSRKRYPTIPDDRVYGASTGTEAVNIVLRLRHLYTKKYSVIPE